jgi:hypothetical protein
MASPTIPLSRIIAAMRSALGLLADTQKIGRANLMMQTVGVLLNAGEKIILIKAS